MVNRSGANFKIRAKLKILDFESVTVQIRNFLDHFELQGPLFDEFGMFQSDRCRFKIRNFQIPAEAKILDFESAWREFEYWHY